VSRQSRKTKRVFKIFCEGDTEYNYFDEMRRIKKFSLSLKPVNMAGGGYSNFLLELRKDSNSNCLCKFIIIDGDRAVDFPEEKRKLEELIRFCRIQNESGRTPHLMVVNYKDFEYIACLHNPAYRNTDTDIFIWKVFNRTVDQLKSERNIYSFLNTEPNSEECLIKAVSKRPEIISNSYKIIKSQFKITVSKTCYYSNNLGIRSSNIQELFNILRDFG